MKRFRFKLEVVLRERKRIEDLKLGEWVLAKNVLQTMVDQRQELEDRLASAMKELSRTDGSSVSLALVGDAFIEGQKIRIEWKKREIERGEKLVEKKRLEYVAVKQKRMALDKLKERKFEEYRDEARKQEQKTLDDTYIMTGAFKAREAEEEF